MITEHISLPPQYNDIKEFSTGDTIYINGNYTHTDEPTELIIPNETKNISLA